MCEFHASQKLWVPLSNEVVIFQHSERLSLPPAKLRRHWHSVHSHPIAYSTDMSRPLENQRQMLDSGEHESCEDGFADAE